MRAKKKIKKLKKGYIWPSVLLCLLILFFSLLFATSTLAMVASYILGYKIEQIGSDIEKITEIMAKTPEAQMQETLEGVHELYPEISSVEILDPDKKPVAQIGEIRWNNEEILFYQNGTLSRYREDNELEEMGFEESMNRFLTALLADGNLKINLSTFDLGDLINETELYEIPFWMKVPATDRMKYDILTRQSITVSKKEVILPILLVIAIVGVTVIFMLLLLINVIISIVNQHRMMKLLYTDTVTGGYNIQYLENYGNTIMHSFWQKGRRYAVLDLKLMHYQHYCLCHGAERGETLLEDLNNFLTKKLARKERCAHMGTGRFALILRVGRDSGEDRAELENRVLSALEEFGRNFDCSSLCFHAGLCDMSIPKGKQSHLVAMGMKKTLDFETCLNNAATARSTIAPEEGTRIVSFGEELLQQQLWEHKVEESMQQALDREEFQVYIQPKYDPVSEKLTGAEALVRWISPTEGFIGPGKFIPIFEKNGFIKKLDDYMITHVAALQAKWIEEGKEIVPVSVNVSRAHFADPDLAEKLCAMVDRYKVPRQYIEIELTESAFFDDKKLLFDTVMKLKNCGFTVSMDDFGAGYSSLNSLKDLPLDILKLDAEFFRGDNTGERGEIVVSRVINLAKDLNMKIVAEGIEEKDQVEFLAGQGCDMIQGYYFAKPMPADDYAQRMTVKEGKETTKTEAEETSKIGTAEAEPEMEKLQEAEAEAEAEVEKPQETEAEKPQAAETEAAGEPEA